jgi:hypothetical protein
LRSTSPARTAIVRDRHQARRIRETPAATQPHCSLRLAVGARDPSQRGLVHRLRGRLPDRSHALLPADDAGCVQLLVIACVALTSTELLPISSASRARPCSAAERRHAPALTLRRQALALGARRERLRQPGKRSPAVGSARRGLA